MPVTDYFLLWKVTVPSSWIAAIIGFFLAWLAVKMKFGKQISDIFADALFTLIIVWKLSVIVTDFETVRRAPMAILYFNGGLAGFLAGIVIAALVILLSRKTQPSGSSRGLLLGIVSAQSGYQVMMALLNDGTSAVKVSTIIGFIAIAGLALVYVKNEEVSIIHAAGFFVAAHTFIAALQPTGFTGIPFVATISASVAVVLISVCSTQRKEKMEGSYE